MKRDHTFSLVTHDGVRFIKLVLLFPNQVGLIKDLHARNKFVLKSGFIDFAAEKGSITMLVDSADQISCVFTDKKSERLSEQVNAI